MSKLKEDVLSQIEELRENCVQLGSNLLKIKELREDNWTAITEIVGQFNQLEENLNQWSSQDAE